MLDLLLFFAKLELDSSPLPNGIGSFCLSRLVPLIKALRGSSCNDVILYRRSVVFLDFFVNPFESVGGQAQESYNDQYQDLSLACNEKSPSQTG